MVTISCDPQSEFHIDSLMVLPDGGVFAGLETLE